MRQTIIKLIPTLSLIMPTLSNATCYEEAGGQYGVSPLLLKSIAMVESNQNYLAQSPMNSNKTVDIGLMQINSAHLPKLATYGISRENLWNACLNTKIAAWILANNFKRYGYNWNAVAAYNTGCPIDACSAGKKKSGLRYINKVISKLNPSVSHKQFSSLQPVSYRVAELPAISHDNARRVITMR